MYRGREWLEYSVEADAAFYFPCRKFGGSDSTFTTVGYTNWKHATDKTKGFARHAKSKEHLSGVAAWKERELRCSTGSEISTLINSDQLSRNRVYVAGIVDTITFLALNELPLRGSIDAVDSSNEKGCGLFLSLFGYTLRQNEELYRADSTIPRNATYTSLDIQNEIIELMATMLTEEIVRDVWGHKCVEEEKLRSE